MPWNLLTKRRDDLPEMRWPLVIASALAACLLGGLGWTFRGGAMVLTVPFVVLSVTAYALLILLWRRLAALTVTFGIGLAVLAFGGDWFTAAGAAVCMLAVAYVYASLFLAKENRFVRIASTASAVGVCALLLTLAYGSMQYDSLGEALLSVCALCRDALADGYAHLAESAGASYVLLPETIDRLLLQAALSLPAFLGMACILFAALCDGGIRFAFWLLDCDGYFTPETDFGITIPRSFGILYGVLLFLVISTDAAGNPPLYAVLSNCHWVFALPCFWVGLTAGYRKLRHALDAASFYRHTRSHSPLPALFILVFFFLIAGLSTAFTLTAALGAVFILLRESGMEHADVEPPEQD